MSINKKYHQLKDNYFINRLGFVSKKSSQGINNYYCKRKYKDTNNTLKMMKLCDIFNPCDACKELKITANKYK
jgi:hypothetical protein